jgi:hypothetical protein
MTQWKAVAPRRQPRGLLEEAVPNEVKDASLTLGRTKKGRSARRSSENFLEQPLPPLDYFKPYV